MKSMLGFRRLVVLHSKTLKSLSNATICSTYSTKPPEITSKPNKETVGDDVNEDKHQIKTNNREINLFGPKDIRAPLNGDIGLGFALNDQKSIQFYEIKPKVQPIDFNSFEDKSLKQYSVIKQFLSPNFDKESETNLLKSMSSPILQCIAHECPILLIRDFQDLFPTSSSKSPDLTKGLTVITLCQKTVNDMSAWTPQVDHEREELMEHFVSVAKNICEYLTNKGFWADFIDPSSGRPFLGEYTSATMFETDERYRNFGFEIEDLGCCKVLSHHVWGTHAFVGALFTTAPVPSPELQEVLLYSQESDQ